MLYRYNYQSEEKRRELEHFEGNNNPYLAYSILSHGRINHKFVVMEESYDFNYIEEKEKEFIDKYDLIKNGFNRRYGGAANILIKDNDKELIPKICVFYKDKSRKDYPKKEIVAEKLNIEKNEFDRVFNLLVRWGVIETYNDIGRDISELSNAEIIAIGHDIKEKVKIKYISKYYNVKYKDVINMRSEMLRESGELAIRGNSYKTTKEERFFISCCLEYGYSFLYTSDIAKKIISSTPLNGSINKSFNVYKKQFTNKSASELYTIIKEYNKDALPILSPLVQNVGRVGYSQQELLDNIIFHYTGGGSVFSFMYYGCKISSDVCYSTIKFVRDGNELLLRDGIELRVNYNLLRERMKKYDEKIDLFGRYISDGTIVCIFNEVNAGTTYTKISELIESKTKEKVSRHFISKNKEKFSDYVNNYLSVTKNKNSF